MKMATEKDNFSFGNYLKSARIEKGISVGDVSATICVGTDILYLIEEEDHENLPEEVFVKSFLRSYAQVVGVNGDRVVHDYLADLHSFRQIEKMEAELLKSSEFFWLRLAFFFGGLFCLMAISVLVLSPASGPESLHNKPVSQTENLEITEDEKRPIAGRGIKEKTDNRRIESTLDNLTLKVTTLEETWITITVDNQDPKEYILNPEDRIELSTTSGFLIRIGNTRGIRIMVNGEPFNLPVNNEGPLTVRIP